MTQDAKETKSERYGVIELGTRGYRILVADATPTGIERVVFSTGGLTPLYYSPHTRTIPPASLADTLRLVSLAVRQCRSNHGSAKVTAFTTEVVRAADNRAEVLQTIPGLLVLDPMQEAYLSCLGASSSFESTCGFEQGFVTIDQGGGSTEVAFGRYPRVGALGVVDHFSVPVGTKALEASWSTAKSIPDATETLADAVAEALDRRKTGAFRPAIAIAVGSSITQFAQEYIRNTTGRRVSLPDLHGTTVPRSALRERVDSFTAETAKIKGPIGDTVPPELLDHAAQIAGLSTYLQVLDAFELDEIIVSRQALRHGVLLKRAGHVVQRLAAS
ncbi:MAG: hypothetical protein Q7W51_02610 [Coriobacteriia bacterium]|nr:hypothetical protein [Coriobacteriia bacterium]